MRRGGLRSTILLSIAALPLVLATTAASAAALPGVPVTVPTTVTVDVPVTVPTVTITIPALPTVTVPQLPTVTIPALPTATVPPLPTTVAPTEIGVVGSVSGADSTPTNDGSSPASPGATTTGASTTAGTASHSAHTSSERPAAHRPPTLLAATRQAAAPFALPLALMLLLAAWMVVRGMHDRRDLRLAAAPVADRWIRFR